MEHGTFPGPQVDTRPRDKGLGRHDQHTPLAHILGHRPTCPLGVADQPAPARIRGIEKGLGMRLLNANTVWQRRARGRRLALGLAVVTAAVSIGVATSATAFGASHTTAPKGDKNAGDVWVDNVGQPAGPGHEMDPHLACADINLWGNRLADSNGTFTIDGWPPSGSQEQVYSATWTYNTTQGGDQIMQVINVATLVANAVAAGDTAVNRQGLRPRVRFDQGPQAPDGSRFGARPRLRRQRQRRRQRQGQRQVRHPSRSFGCWCFWSGEDGGEDRCSPPRAPDPLG